VQLDVLATTGGAGADVGRDVSMTHCCALLLVDPNVPTPYHDVWTNKH
jgi:hypothetical protein